MKANMIILRVGRLSELREVSFKSEEPTYDELKGLIVPLILSLDGDHSFEHVTVLYEGKRCDMFVDEFGQPKRLPFNEHATRIYRASWLNRHPGTDPDSLPDIAGDAIVFDRQVWF